MVIQTCNQCVSTNFSFIMTFTIQSHWSNFNVYNSLLLTINDKGTHKFKTWSRSNGRSLDINASQKATPHPWK